MTIRIYKPVDDIAATLANVRQDAIQNSDPLALIRQEAIYRSCLASPLRAFRVARIDGVDAAFASVMFNRGKAMMDDMYVMRGYDRRGAGTRLFDAIMKAARDEGHDEISWVSLLEATGFFTAVAAPYGGKVQGVFNFSCQTRRIRRPRTQAKKAAP